MKSSPGTLSSNEKTRLREIPSDRVTAEQSRVEGLHAIHLGCLLDHDGNTQEPAGAWWENGGGGKGGRSGRRYIPQAFQRRGRGYPSTLNPQHSTLHTKSKTPKPRGRKGLILVFPLELRIQGLDCIQPFNSLGFKDWMQVPAASFRKMQRLA